MRGAGWFVEQSMGRAPVKLTHLAMHCDSFWFAAADDEACWLCGEPAKRQIRWGDWTPTP